MEQREFYSDLSNILRQVPEAFAVVRGTTRYSQIYGEVRFYSVAQGVIVAAEVKGLPMGDAGCDSGVFGFHIHEGTECTGDKKDPLGNTGQHYNPKECKHPFHAGDMPPLFGGTHGNALLAFFTDRFTISEIEGRTVVIHAKPDDFTTQPSGASGEKIACGRIMVY